MRRFSALILSLLVCATASAQAPYLVKDFALGTGPADSNVTLLGSLGNTVLFVAMTPYEGFEVWKTDGTSGGTTLVADHVPGPRGVAEFVVFSHVLAGKLIFGSGSSYPELVTRMYATDGSTIQHLGTLAGQTWRTAAVFNGHLYGVRSGPAVDQKKLWRTNGTTLEEIEFTQLPGYQDFGEIVTAGNALYFIANGALWRSDGTSAGTASIAPADSDYIAALGSKVLFRQTGMIHATDGTAAGTVRLNESLRAPEYLHIRVFGNLAFVQDERSLLWVTDGSVAGTRSIQSPVYTAPIGAVGSRVYLSDARDLWYIENGAAPMVHVKSMYARIPFRDEAYHTVALGNRLVFVGARTGTETSIWSTDGTAAGTIALNQFRVGGFGTFETGKIAQLGNRVVFANDPEAPETELLISDGTPAGTTVLKEFLEGKSSVLMPWGAVRNRLLFTDSTSFHDLYATDGTADGTTKLTTMANGTATHRGEQWFHVDPPESGSELWQTDGTLNGTTLFSTTLAPQVQLVAGMLLDGGNGDLRLSDGTSHGTRALEEAVQQDLPLTDWTYINAAHGIAYYAQSSPFRLWRVDGTNAGTRLVTDLGGNPLSYAGRSAVMGNTVLFILSDGRLVRTDGTTAGTSVLRTFTPAPDRMWGAGPRAFLRFDSQKQLWVTDGTAAGTKLLRENWNIASERGCSSFPGGRINGVSVWMQPQYDWFEIWRSDGTAEGTFEIPTDDVYPQQWCAPQLALAHGRLYFANGGPDFETELWSTDGTLAGTAEVADLAGSLFGSLPQHLTIAGTHLYFTATTPETGRELYALANVNRLPSLATVASRRVTPGMAVTFTLSGSDADADTVTYYAMALPFGATLNGTTGAFAWTPTNAQTGMHTITFVSADGVGGTATQTVMLSVGNSNAFTDDPLRPGMYVKAVHFSELLIAVNEYRARASLGPISLTNFGAGLLVRGAHLTTLRNGINQARLAMGLTAMTFASDAVIKATHVQELRDAVR